MRCKHIFLIYILTGTLVLITLSHALIHPQAASAQTSGWSTPVNISNSPGQSMYPSLVADPAGMIHLVWTEEAEEQPSVILYTQLVNGVWSEPIDIIASKEDPKIKNPLIAIDSRGYLQLVYFSFGLYYTNVYAPLARSVKDWQQPLELVQPMNSFSVHDFAIGPEDDLHVVYAIQVGVNSGVYYIRSSDHGETWQYPQSIRDNPKKDRAVNHPKIIVDEQGTLHVVWVEQNYPETYPPRGIFYSRSLDGVSWSKPVALGLGPYDDPEIVAYKNEIHVVWSGTASDRFKFHKWSSDGGSHWAGIWRNMELGGLQGSPSLVFDSAGVAHWLQVGTIFVVGSDALYENVFIEGEWSPGNIIYNGSIEGMNMGDAIAVVRLGNQLHVATWKPTAFQDEVWLGDIVTLSKNLDSPAYPVQPYAEPTYIPTIQPTLALPVTAVSSPTAVSKIPLPQPQPAYSVYPTIAVGAVPVIVILGILYMLRMNKR